MYAAMIKPWGVPESPKATETWRMIAKNRQTLNENRYVVICVGTDGGSTEATEKEKRKLDGIYTNSTQIH